MRDDEGVPNVKVDVDEIPEGDALFAKPATDEEDPLAAVAGGELHFDLFGEKLAGRFVLVRTDGRNRRRTGGRQDEWLLLHKRDDHAVDGWDPEAHPRSVKSGRTNDEVAAAPEAPVRPEDLDELSEDELEARLMARLEQVK